MMKNSCRLIDTRVMTKVSPSVYTNDFIPDSIDTNFLKFNVVRLENDFSNRLIIKLLRDYTEEFYDYETRELADEIHNTIADITTRSTERVTSRIMAILIDEWEKTEKEASIKISEIKKLKEVK